MGRRSRGLRSPDLVWDGKGTWWSCGYRAGPPGGDSNLWMCANDTGTAIWLHFQRLDPRFSFRGGFQPVQLECCSDALCSILVDSIPYNEYRDDLTGAVVNFTKMVAQQLVLEGSMPFEVQAGWDHSDGHPRLCAARLKFLYPDSLVRIGRRMYQIIPKGVDRDKTEGRVVRLDSSRIVTFRPPRMYRRALQQLRRGLVGIGRSEYNWMAAGPEEWAGEFISMTRAYNTARARLSAPLGWNARGLFRDYIADYHWALRELQWHRFAIDMREEILTTLSAAFTMIGQLQGESPSLKWHGLPTISEVDDAEAALEKGGVRLRDLLKPFTLELGKSD